MKLLNAISILDPWNGEKAQGAEEEDNVFPCVSFFQSFGYFHCIEGRKKATDEGRTEEIC